MRVLMVAAENDRLPDCKVGGVADVIRDIPYALNAQGITVKVVVPDYGQHQLNRTFVSDIAVPFRQHLETATLWQVEQDDGVIQYVISHSLFSEHQGAIYCSDDHRPFATDATKFAFFNAAVCEAIEHKMFADLDVLHLHDWHAACITVLQKFSPRFVYLKQLKTVYTVHNLALQGIRPFNHDESSLEAWFPTLGYDGQQLCDHQHPHCFNPMRSAIALADKVHVVSATYSDEVLLTSEPDRGFFGGEGLEHDMQIAKRQGKLVGILNGCEYPKESDEKISLTDYLSLVDCELIQWMSKQVQLRACHYIAHQRLKQWQQTNFDGPLITSVGRLTNQKALILRQPLRNASVIDELANLVANFDGRIIILGSGDVELENLFTQVMSRHNNLLYLNGYGQHIGDLLYDLGDLFLMPSSFEPCGISQMLAMRAGQPCLVHQVGGLVDTVTHLHNGFSFCGEDLNEQATQLIDTFNLALNIFKSNPEQYQQIANNAAQSRYTWQTSAQAYISNLYE